MKASFLRSSSVLVAVAFAAVGLFAEETVVLWRGETRAVRLPDCVETPFASPAGMTLRFGALKTVKYSRGRQHRADALQYALAADRVDWSGAGEGQRVVEISVGRECPAGTYGAGGQVRFVVLDRVLPPPREWKYFLDLWQHPWAVARLNGVKPFSPEHYRAMRPVWELLATAGQKTLTVTLLEQPWAHQCRDAYHPMVRTVRAADGSWSYDYRLFDEYVEFGRSCGLGPVISCYTMCPWGYQVSWEDERGTLRRQAAVPGQPFFEEYWGPFLAAFSRHLREKGWLADACIAMDERSPKDVRTVVDFVRKTAPGLKVSMAGNRKPSEFTGITIDNYCQYLVYVDAAFLREAAARRERGLVTTMYVCSGPGVPNTCLDSNDGEPFWTAFYPAAAGLDGFLRWAWNSWGIDPMNDGSYGKWKPGDTYLVYPDGSPAWRFLELRNGIIAAEKYRILREAGENVAELDALAKRFDLKAALDGKADWLGLREAVQRAVNR